MIRDDWKDFQKGVARLIARTWIDEEFKSNFITNPAQVLQGNSLTLPDDVEVQVVEDGSRTRITNREEVDNADSPLIFYISLPPKPDMFTRTQMESFVLGDGDGGLLPTTCCC